MEHFGKKGTYEDEFEDEISKSQIKRELLALKDLGKELVELPVRDLDKLDLSERLYESLVKAHGMTKGAFKRQVGTIGKVLIHEDHEAISAKLEKIRQVHNGEIKQFHQLEVWRDELLSGDANVMATLRNEFEDFDMQHVRQLVRNATKELEQNKPAKSARLLFKYLKECDTK